MATARKQQGAIALEAWRGLCVPTATSEPTLDKLRGDGGKRRHGSQRVDRARPKAPGAVTSSRDSVAASREQDESVGDVALGPRAAALAVLGHVAVRAATRPFGFFSPTLFNKDENDDAAKQSRKRPRDRPSTSVGENENHASADEKFTATPRACQGCWTLLVPGESCSLRTEPQRTPKRLCAEKGGGRAILVASCHVCGAHTVLGRGPTRKEKKWFRQEAADPTKARKRHRRGAKTPRGQQQKKTPANSQSSSEVRVAAAKALGVLAASQAARAHGGDSLLDRLSRNKQQRSITASLTSARTNTSASTSASANASKPAASQTKPPSTLQSFFAALNRGK